MGAWEMTPDGIEKGRGMSKRGMSEAPRKGQSGQGAE